MKNLSMIAVTAFAAPIAFAAPQFRPMAMTVNRSDGEVVSFDLSFSQAAGTTALYACWGSSDAGATTSAWEHVVKVADVPADATNTNVPISFFPRWGRANCRAIRFVMLPGALFDYATEYLATENFGGSNPPSAATQRIDTGYVLTEDDTAEVAWTHTHPTSQGNTLILGTPRFNMSNGTGTGGFIIRYAGNHTVDSYISTVGVGLGTHDAEYTATFNKGSYIGAETITKVKCSPFERVIWTNRVDSVGDFVEVGREDTPYAGGELNLATNCFLFGWPGQVVANQVRYTPFSGENRMAGRMYYFDISRNGVSVANGIPCVKDGEACFYDSARRIFLYQEDRSQGRGFRTDSPRADAGVYTDAVVYEGVVPPQNEWTGAVGDWNDAANWSLERTPAAGDEITIPTGATVSLSNATPALLDLTVGGTLCVTGWTSKIEASTVTVARGGVLTCTGGATTETDLSRVWIVCTDLTVASGGAIDVSAKGYAPYPSTTMPGMAVTDVSSSDSVAGFGPGALWYRRGATHGGVGAFVRNYLGHRRVLPCDDVEEPVQPGSSGSSSRWNIGTAGGGAVRIDAAGIVTVDGSISADAADTVNTSGTYTGCGAGGSVLVHCRTFCGEGGSVTACGGSGNVDLQTANNAPYFAGGGGRIAIHYESTGATSGMTFSAAEGRALKTAFNAQDAYFGDADAGTLWFSDDMFLKFLGTGLSGQLVSTASQLEFDSISMTFGRVRFARPGVSVTVRGDVSVSGPSARLEFGGDTPTNRVYDCDLMTTRPWTFSVGGDLTLSGGGRLDLRGAYTNASDVCGGTLSVAGGLTVGADSSLYCWSDVENGGSPKIQAGAFSVEADGLVSAEKRGFAGGYNDTYAGTHHIGHGPGAGSNPGWYCQGGGHGGAGGLEGRIDTASTSYGSHANDDEYIPALPGSGGAATGWSHQAAGGGVVNVTVAGAIVVDGTVNVDGEASGNIRGGAGAGGTIYLKGATFSGAATGLLSAKGGAAFDVAVGANYYGQSGAGGGGRIAVWTGRDWNGKTGSSRLTRGAVPDGLAGFSYLGLATAAGGASEMSVAEGVGGTLKDVSCAGSDGTVWFFNFADPTGMIFIFR